MAAWSRFLVEPIFRLIFGRPLADRLPGDTASRTKTVEQPLPSNTLDLRLTSPAAIKMSRRAGDWSWWWAASEGSIFPAPLAVCDGCGEASLCHSCLSLGTRLWQMVRRPDRVSNRDAQGQPACRRRSPVPGQPARRPGLSRGQVGRLRRDGQGARAARGRLGRPRHPACAGLSPDYDLTAALHAVASDMVVFWSPLDVYRPGCRNPRVWHGRSGQDRQRGHGWLSSPLGGGGAGATTPRPYARLRQIRWIPQMAATGNLGGHLGPDSPVFLKNYVLPLLRTGPDAGS